MIWHIYSIHNSIHHQISVSSFPLKNQYRTSGKDKKCQRLKSFIENGGKKHFSIKRDQIFASQSNLSSDGGGEQYKTERALFKLYMNPATEKINMGHFLLALEKTGLRRSDPRLFELMDALEELHNKIGEEGTTPENIDLPFESFQRLIEQNLVLISQAFSHKLIIPDFTDFCTFYFPFTLQDRRNTNPRQQKSRIHHGRKKWRLLNSPYIW